MSEGYEGFKFSSKEDELSQHESNSNALSDQDKFGDEFHRQTQVQALNSITWDQMKFGEDIKLWKARVDREAAEGIAGVAESDIVAGVYEGGFKLWEGAEDLCNFLARDLKKEDCSLVFKNSKLPKGSRVMELGCGHGMPGILCLLAGAEVHFQDYNIEVLQSLTAFNVEKNIDESGITSPMPRYFYGGFAAVANKIYEKGYGGSYRLILSSETLYNIASYRSFLLAIKQMLQPPEGIALIASKAHYFGVGGGTHSFKSFVEADGVLECKTIWTMDDGASNKREILVLNFPQYLHPYFS